MKTKYNKNILYIALAAFGISNCHAGADRSSLLEFVMIDCVMRVISYANCDQNIEYILNDKRNCIGYDSFFIQIKRFNALCAKKPDFDIDTAYKSFANFIIKDYKTKNMNPDSLLEKIERLNAIYPL